MSVRIAALLMIAAAAACGFFESAPNPSPKPATAVSAGGEGGVGGGGGGEPVRTVTVRSPWGGPRNNLLVDGDFELSIGLQGHESPNAWYAFAFNQGQRYLRGETGGLCKSGLRCAVLEQGIQLIGRGTAAADANMTASIWVRPPQGKGCDVVSTSVLPCDESLMAVKLKATEAMPDSTGWCSYSASLLKHGSKMCMIIDSKLGIKETALVDSATLLADVTNKKASPTSASETPEHHRALLRRLRDVTPFGRPAQLPPALLRTE
jgi:hypothetical protein